MTRFRPVLTIAAVLSAWVPLSVASAGSSAIPPGLYPHGAHITFKPELSNQDVDCMWGFICDGNLPNFHTLPQDVLDRVGGWGQFAGLRKHGKLVMAFELFASQYAAGNDEGGTPWAQNAYADLQAALLSRRFNPLHDAPSLLSSGMPGAWLAEIQRSGTSDLVVMAAWTGDRDSEAIVAFDHRSSADRATAISLLAAQVRQSLNQ